LLPCDSAKYAGSVNFKSNDAMVNSPNTVAKLRNEALMIPTFRFGKITMRVVRIQLAPSERDASTKVFKSIAPRLVSNERNVNGKEMIT